MTTEATLQGAAPRSRSRFGLMVVLVGLVAFALRQHFVLATVIDIPIRGDINEYVAYAWNLATHGVYSGTIPPAPPIPDSYRSIGYPALIALGMKLWPTSDWLMIGGWYPFVLEVQVLLGTLTCVLASLLARHWLKPAWAIGAGLLLAVWPHHVAATGALLLEVVFGFLLVFACYAFARAWSSDKAGWYAVTGAIFGLAYLVNPLALLFPPLLCLLALAAHRRLRVIWLLAVFLVPVTVLAVRSASLANDQASNSQRAVANFVQGSWPQYHLAHRAFRGGDPIAIAMMDEINRETRLLTDDPWLGLATVAKRFAYNPPEYARWYLVEKPMLLWNWDIQIGAGGIYPLVVRNSPLDSSPVLRGIVQAIRFANPVLSILTLASAIVLAVVGWRKPGLAIPAVIATLALYLTLIHVTLQAEPRYATAYRGLEAILVMTALSWAVTRFRTLRSASPSSSSAA